jgi:hypothetical protein
VFNSAPSNAHCTFVWTKYALEASNVPSSSYYSYCLDGDGSTATMASFWDFNTIEIKKNGASYLTIDSANAATFFNVQSLIRGGLTVI